MIDEKIDNLKLEISTLKRDFLEFTESKSCKAGIHMCDFAHAWKDFSKEVDQLMKPSTDAVKALQLIPDNENMEKNIAEMLPYLVMSLLNVFNRIMMQLNHQTASLNADNTKTREELHLLQERLLQTHQTLNRIMLIGKSNDLFETSD